MILEALMLSTALTAAQAPQAVPPGGEEDVVLVTATRIEKPINAIPSTVRLIDSEALADQLAINTNLIDALSTFVPSFSPSRQKLTGFGESFRGRSPLYLIDGVPQSNPLRDGSRDGFTLDPSVIERIEVIYGANAIQGIGATGGIVNYVTLSPAGTDDWQFTTEAQFVTDDGVSEDGQTWRGAATAARDFGAFDAVFAIAAEDRGIFYDGEGRTIGTDGTQGDIADSTSLNLFTKLGWDLGEQGRLQLMVNSFTLEGHNEYVALAGDRTTGLPTTAVPGSERGDAAENDVLTASLTYTRPDTFGGDLTVQLFRRDFEAVFGGGTFGVFQDPAFAPVGTLFDQSANNSDKTGLKTTWVREDFAVDGLTFAVGLDILKDETFQELIQTGRNWVPQTEFVSVGPFVQLEQVLMGDRLRLSGGVRYEMSELKVDDFTSLAFYGSQPVEGGEPSFEEAIYNFGAVFDATEEVTLYASYAKGFTMPDVGRVLRGINQTGVDVDTLLDLEPIIADNLEIGATFERGALRVNASYFWSQSDFGQRLVPDANGIFSVAREETEIEGFEAAVEYTLPGDRIGLGANYAHVEGRFDSDGDGVLDTDLGGANISPDRLNLFVRFQATDRLSLRAQSAVLFDRTFEGGDPRNDFEGYELVDLAAAWQLGDSGQIDFAVQNAFDEQYITYYSQTNAPTSDTRFFAGQGRTLSVRWSNRF